MPSCPSRSGWGCSWISNVPAGITAAGNAVSKLPTLPCQRALKAWTFLLVAGLSAASSWSLLMASGSNAT